MNGTFLIQVNSLQSFKLPRPVLCIGGVIQVELLGRVQKQRSDQEYYIWCVFPRKATFVGACFVKFSQLMRARCRHRGSEDGLLNFKQYGAF